MAPEIICSGIEKADSIIALEDHRIGSGQNDEIGDIAYCKMQMSCYIISACGLCKQIEINFFDRSDPWLGWG